MATHEMGSIRSVSVGKLWDSEASDFTPWLAENLDALGEALGMDLEWRGSEVPAGDFRLDILARDAGRDLTVAIENQLYGTDHSHLGQLLTYASHFDARVVVWITPRFREEHRAAIDWLNRLTSDDVEFYGVEVRAIKIEGREGTASLPAPEFRPVAFPNTWTRGGPVQKKPGSQNDAQALLDFFEPLVQQLRERGFTEKRHAAKGKGQNFRDGCVEQTYYGVGFWFTYAIVYLVLWDKALYDHLKARQDKIDSALQHAGLRGEIRWRKPKGYHYREILLLRKGSIDDPAAVLNKTRGWMANSLPKFKEIINPHIEELAAELARVEKAESSEQREWPNSRIRHGGPAAQSSQPLAISSDSLRPGVGVSRLSS